MTCRELLCIFSHKGGIGETYLFVLRISPYDVVVHRHEDDPSVESFWLTSQGFHKFLDFVENLQRSESWENHPLEFHRLSIDSMQFSVLLDVLNQFNLAFHSSFDSGN